LCGSLKSEDLGMVPFAMALPSYLPFTRTIPKTSLRYALRLPHIAQDIFTHTYLRKSGR
jgi:hypothetical protein